MKTVFPSAQVAHIWAQQNQEQGRNSGGSLYFNGPSIYSYGSHFEIARFVTNKRGEQAVLETSRSYSISTSRHQSYVRRAIRDGVPVFTVADIDSAARGKARDEFQATLTALIGKAVRSRTHTEWHVRDARALVASANAYAAFFGQRWRLKDPTFDKAEFSALIKRQKAAADKRERDTQKKLKADFDKAAIDWRNGDGMYMPYRGPIMLRLSADGETVETSHGAQVPANDARRLIPFIRLAKSGQDLTTSGVIGMRIGHFRVDRIDSDGTLTAGCHTIQYAEIERCARLLGIDAATDRAVSVAIANMSFGD